MVSWYKCVCINIYIHTHTPPHNTHSDIQMYKHTLRDMHIIVLATGVPEIKVPIIHIQEWWFKKLATQACKLLPDHTPIFTQFIRSVVYDSVTPWTAAHQASLSLITSQSLLKLMSIESVMPSNHLVLCCPLLLLLSIFPSIRVFYSPNLSYFTPSALSSLTSYVSSIIELQQVPRLSETLGPKDIWMTSKVIPSFKMNAYVENALCSGKVSEFRRAGF